jgi:hypothetical protein
MIVTDPRAADDVLRLRDIAFDEAAALLASYGLRLLRVDDGAPIPGSYWGEPEAGIVGCDVHARGDTPVHSLLHEACHLIVLPADRRRAVHTDATDSVEEEDAVCVLQSLLGDALPGVGRDRVLADMDAWGYTSASARRGLTWSTTPTPRGSGCMRAGWSTPARARCARPGSRRPRSRSGTAAVARPCPAL